MRHTTLALTAVALAAAVAGAAAQKTTPVHPGKAGSPHVRAEWTIDGASLSIEYGRPFLKGRPEAELMPPGKEWRTGADEATVLKTSRPLKFGSLSVPAGTYQIHSVPGATNWQLIISKSTQAWGIPYPAGQDLGRTPMTVSKTKAPVEQLTISVDDTPAGGTLRIEWGTTSAQAPFTIG
jgi:Protein of unknown function (DUF2911)